MSQSGQKIPLNTHWNTGGTLVLTRVTLSDSGKYVCVANNTMGQDRAERDVVVTGKCCFVLLHHSHFSYRQVGNTAEHAVHSIVNMPAAAFRRIFLAAYASRFTYSTAFRHSIRRLAFSTKRIVSMRGLKHKPQRVLKISRQILCSLNYHGNTYTPS